MSMQDVYFHCSPSNVIQSVAVCPVVEPFNHLDPNLPDTHGMFATDDQSTVNTILYHTVSLSLFRCMLQSSVS